MTAPRLLGPLVCLVVACGFLAGRADPEPRCTIRLGAPEGSSVELAGLDARTLTALAKGERTPEQWAVLFALYVAKEGQPLKDTPPVGGTYRVVKDVLRFEPRYPLARGVSYRAVFHPGRLPESDPARADKVVSTPLLLPRLKTPPAVVEVVYPTAERLPENQLKFYLHFSAPMSRGEAYRRVRLLDDKGKAVELPFLELDEELWDPAGKRFTLFFDPGRIKRGLKPREEVGPALVEGKRYTLEIDRRWADAEGQPLKETFRKTFTVLAPDDKQPDPKTWKLLTPAAASRQPLVVTFPKPMDHALLQRLLWVAQKGKRLDGSITVTKEETRWEFTPAEPWAAGTFDLVADTRLEDLAGNSIGKPFEVDVFRPVQREIKTETVKRSFTLATK